MKVREFLTFSLVFSPMVPSIDLAGKSIYIFDLFFPMIIFYLFLTKARVKDDTIYLSATVLFIGVSVASLQLILWGHIHSSSVIRFSFIALLIPLLKDIFPFYNFKNFLSLFLISISLLGILQFIDGFLLNGLFKVNKLVSSLYPYAGDLSESNLTKTSGNYIKSGSFNRATSIADGHPIIFGDLVATLSIFLLFWRKYTAYIISAIAVVLTFSRGSWLMLAVGFIAFIIIEFRKIGFKFYVALIFTLLSSLLIVLSNDSVYNALQFRVINTLYTFGLSDLSVGRANDPRTDIVWPNFFSAMNEVGWTSYLVGYDVGLPTDSGHFAILRESGILGYLVFSLVSIYSIIKSRFDRSILSILLIIFFGMIFHPIQQGYKTVFLSTVSIAYCIKISKKMSKT